MTIISKEEITKNFKEQAIENAKRMKKPMIIPVYIAIDINEEGMIGTIAQGNTSHMLGKVIAENEDLLVSELRNCVLNKKILDIAKVVAVKKPSDNEMIYLKIREAVNLEKGFILFDGRYKEENLSFDLHDKQLLLELNAFNLRGRELLVTL